MALRATRILDATTEDWTGPKIANSRAGARHLVVATRKASSTTAPMIVGRFVYPGNNDVGPVGAISTGSLDCANPDIGGSNGTSTSGAQFCVVYSRTFSDFRVDVVAKRLSMTGLAVGAESIVSGVTEQFNERPAISNVHDGSGWAIAFERMGWDASGPYCKQVWGAQLALTGAVAGPVAVSTLVASRTNAFDTVTTCVLPRTEANMRWIVGYTRQLAGNPDVELVSLNGLGIRATSSAHAVRGASSALLEAQPSLAFAGGSNIALAFTSTTAAGVGARIIYTRIPMITAGLLVGTFGTANNTTYVSPTGSACVQPVLGSRLENGATGNADFFVAWTVQGVLDIRGVLFRALGERASDEPRGAAAGEEDGRWPGRWTTSPPARPRFVQGTWRRRGATVARSSDWPSPPVSNRRPSRGASLRPSRGAARGFHGFNQGRSCSRLSTETKRIRSGVTCPVGCASPAPDPERCPEFLTDGAWQRRVHGCELRT
jgi:hypothetical protein